MVINVYGNVYVNQEDILKNPAQNIRKSPAVQNAKRNVKKRDACCQICGEKDKILEVHHILPVAKYPDLAADERNMITLCQHHHRKYHEAYEGCEGADTFSKWILDINGGI